MDYSTLLNPTIIGIALLWNISALSSYTRYTYLLQLKEYRFDRMKDFYRSREGHTFLVQPDQLWGAIIAFGLYTIFADSGYIVQAVLVALGLHVLYTVHLVFFAKTFRRPRFTIKALLILFSTVAIEGLILLFTQKLNLILVVIVSRPILIFIVGLLFQLSTKATKRVYIYFATKKISRYPNLIVIGITGSYGKSSVKEFLAHILASRYTVVKTKGNINTEIGIARFILSHNFSNDDIFICEMGAYRIGEINIMCNMVKPKIGILTAINEQHLSLFGSIKNIQQAKYELLRSIPEEGLVITYADNPYCTELLDTVPCKNIHTFGTDPDKYPACLITNIKTRVDGTSYEGICNGEKGEIHTPVIGAHHSFNIAASILAASFLNIPKTDVIDRCTTLPTKVHGSLQIYSYGRATIIDDSYNSNPTGFRAALDVFAQYPSDKKRIVITRGMLELANQSVDIHEQIGGEIAFVADTLVIITEDSYTDLARGVGDKYQTEILLLKDHAALLSYIQTLQEQPVVILLENRMPSLIEKELQPYRTAR